MNFSWRQPVFDLNRYSILFSSKQSSVFCLKSFVIELKYMCTVHYIGRCRNTRKSLLVKQVLDYYDDICIFKYGFDLKSKSLNEILISKCVKNFLPIHSRVYIFVIPALSWNHSNYRDQLPTCAEQRFRKTFPCLIFIPRCHWIMEISQKTIE